MTGHLPSGSISLRQVVARGGIVTAAWLLPITLAGRLPHRPMIQLARVRLVFGDDRTVEASVVGGWYAAWWPSAESDFVLEGLAGDGTQLYEGTG